ncbi:hypothetical protein [Pseudobutyrivibrio sp.]|uniref:hypothetical protein n=1 Tax=Pseudobutyrivibrio sp. TaxID=2014367 RepID=UPI0025E75321|nr:hypothetical protein [Pseudobutyrivibrio sp.]MBR5650286.1 hypothetical protein [Pseudobutyrivibrio sp.]
MKKMKLVWLSMAIIGTVVSFAACGDKGGSSDGGNDSFEEGILDDEPEGDDNVPEADEEVAFGAGVAAEYPISSAMQSQLDALDSNYKKVNWQVAYAPADNDAIIVSETKYNYEGRNHLVVAYTNLSDAGVKISFEGYAENTGGEVVFDILEDNVEIGPQNTIARDYLLNEAEPSGEIKWNSFTVEASSEEYIPFEITSELKKDNSENYYIESIIDSETRLEYGADKGYGFVLDNLGNIIVGGEEFLNNKVEFNIKSFGGEEVDVVYYVNGYKVNW